MELLDEDGELSPFGVDEDDYDCTQNPPRDDPEHEGERIENGIKEASERNREGLWELNADFFTSLTQGGNGQ